MSHTSRAPRRRVAGRRTANRPWTDEEDDALRSLVNQHSEASWSIIAEDMPYRDSKSCRHRWFNQLRPGINKSPFSAWEDAVIVRSRFGERTSWTSIARLLPGRTNNAVKNRWNCTLKRLLQDTGGGGHAEPATRENDYLASGLAFGELMKLKARTSAATRATSSAQPAGGAPEAPESEDSGSSPSHGPGASPLPVLPSGDAVQCHGAYGAALSILDSWSDSAVLPSTADTVPSTSKPPLDRPVRCRGSIQADSDLDVLLKLESQSGPLPRPRLLLEKRQLLDRYRSSCGSAVNISRMHEPCYCLVSSLEEEATKLYFGPELTCDMKSCCGPSLLPSA